MKKIIKAFSLALLVLLSACNDEHLKEKLIPKEESKFADTFLKNIHEKNFSEIKKYVDPSIAGDVSDKKLEEISDYFPKGELLSTELIGSRVNTFNSQWNGTFTYEYHYSTGWAVANVVMKKNGDSLTVVGFHINRTLASQREINKFTFSNKSLIHYGIFALAIFNPIFIIISAYFCFRTPIPKRKWLWIIGILMGVCLIRLNWQTGQTAMQLVYFQLLGAGYFYASDASPLILTASVPLGAILFWIKRKSFLNTASPIKEAIDVVPSTEN